MSSCPTTGSEPRSTSRSGADCDGRGNRASLPTPEDLQSGQTAWCGCAKPYRGFESLFLRQFPNVCSSPGGVEFQSIAHRAGRRDPSLIARPSAIDGVHGTPFAHTGSVVRNTATSYDTARHPTAERCTRAARTVIACGLLVTAPPIQSASTNCRSAGDLRLPSPDGRREMLLYVRICGDRATGEVEIVQKGAPVPDRPGNIDVPGHPIEVSGRWTSDAALILAVPGTNALPKPQRIDGVTVTFVRLIKPGS